MAPAGCCTDALDFPGKGFKRAIYFSVCFHCISNISPALFHYNMANGEFGNTQVPLQHWKDDKIIGEEFFYGN